MSGGDDRTFFPAGPVRPPTDAAALATHLHLALDLMPGADPPVGVILRQLLSYVGLVARAAGTGAREDEEQALIRTRRLDSQIARAGGAVNAS